MAEKIFASSGRKRKLKKGERSECQICGSSALYSYCGVTSCDACKMFFKRNAYLGQNFFNCANHGQCHINRFTRHTCASCRLSKCFQMGMKAEMIRRSFVNRNKQSTSNVLIKSNQFGKLPTLNLLDRDNSLLNDSQWTLLSNLIHNYQDSRLFSMSKRIKNEIHSLKFIDQISLQNLLTTLYEVAGKSLASNLDIAHLPFDDRIILLTTAATNATCVGAQFIFYHSQLHSHDLFWYYLEQIYGKLAVTYNIWSSNLTDPDPILCKLSIALYTFSSNTRVFHRDTQIEYTNNKESLNIQNKYAELTWKYLLYKYGYKDTIRKYLRLMEWFLALTVTMYYVHHIDRHVNDIESLVEKTELTLVLNDVDRLVNEMI